MKINLTFEDFNPAACLLESRVDFLHSFKTSARILAQVTEDSRLFEAHRRRLSFKVNNYRLPLMASLEKMPDAISKKELFTLTTYMTLLWNGRNDLTREEVFDLSDKVISSYESLADYLQAKNQSQQYL